MKNVTSRIFILISYICVAFQISGQVVFQIEKYNNPVPIKYYVGDMLNYKEVSFPKDWKKEQITEINDKDKIIEFETGYVKMKDIIAIRRSKPTMSIISKMLYSFGVAWAFFGTIAHLKDGYEIRGDTYAIGGLSIFGGWVFSRFHYKNIKINNRNHLRIIDISWPDPIKE